MKSSVTENRSTRFDPFKNWVSLTGAVISGAGLFSFLLLFLLDTFSHRGNPYLGILSYVVAPGFIFGGLAVVVVGWWMWRRKGGLGGLAPRIRLDFNEPRHRRAFVFFGMGSVAFLMVSAAGVYGTFHYTESVTFCGDVCHVVMEPERVTHRSGPHARVACVECHIGAGAGWYVKSKLSGMRQLYAVSFHTYSTPIPTPVHNLRPARDTCEECHWPSRFVGNKVKNYEHFLGDATNTQHTIRLELKVGGADDAHGGVHGIHWHIANKVEYLPGEETRQSIPYVRTTDAEGRVTEFRTAGFTNAVAEEHIRLMDCMDCHNRPSHRYRTPNEAVNQAMRRGLIPAALPWIKTNAVYALLRPYATADEAKAQIAAFLGQKYPNDPRIGPAIAAAQQIYAENFFPAMKASWRTYPENIGHKDWPGCARCHDDQHTSTDGQRRIGFRDCSLCHVILTQGQGDQLNNLNAKGQPFHHPNGDLPDGYQCHECHNGTP